MREYTSAILEATLARLGAAVEVCLPHRDEGYGLSESAVHRFSRAGTKVLVAIDNGINAVRPVHLAQRLGMTVLVVDHHQIETRADTQAIWSDQFCAAGLAYMLSASLLEQSNLPWEAQKAFLASLSRLAAIACIADCVPVTLHSIPGITLLCFQPLSWFSLHCHCTEISDLCTQIADDVQC